ncbi:MAG: T9SS type A sorting domain-containing protein [Bacteroidales bacterium]|nr:T9SS type A sorting domain-containing protein [Bacteroidales bacterium]
MKRTLFFASMVVAAFACQAQYQLPNPGFEQWDGSSATAEPVHWNSFASSDGSYASMASAPHHYHRQGGRPGSTGSSYLTIYTKSILGIKANGNMTTGRIHAGALSASSSDNYNYTQRSNADHRQPFTGTPDSMYVWVSFYAGSSSSHAQVTAYLHGDNDFRAPNDEGNTSLYCGIAQASFTRTTTSASSMQWQQLKVPFVYSGSSTANYMLINLTTNATPGGGAANDSLSIDDIEFVYSAWLSGITVGGEPIDGFEKGVMAYSLHVDDLEAEVNATTEVSDATVTVSRQAVSDTTVRVTIDVVAEDNTTMRTYTVTLSSGAPAVGIAQPLNQLASQLHVYPNPATDKVSVEADGCVEMYDMYGRRLSSSNVRGCTTMSMDGMPAGIYLLRCGGATTRIVKR